MNTNFRVLAFALFTFAPIVAVASDTMDKTTLTLRSADEPNAAKKQWEQGAGIAFNSVDGKETWQTDAVLKIIASSLKQSDLIEVPSIKRNLSGGVFLHKMSGGDTPSNDRGVSLGADWHVIPGGSAAGGVVSYDIGVNGSMGKTLKFVTDASGQSKFDVDTKRLTAIGSMYYQPQDSSMYFRFAGGAYMDHASASPKKGVNGRESGLLASVQFSVYPFGMSAAENKLGPWVVAPLFTLKAQRQRDLSASGEREKAGYTLYSAVMSFPFTIAGVDPGYVPSFDIKRSVGADLLTGRTRSGQTSVLFTLKY